MNMRILSAATLVGLFAAGPATADIVVSFDPPFQTVGLGEVFTVNIVASIPEADATVGWGLDFSIVDPSLVTQTATLPMIGPAWDAAAAPDGDGLAGLAPTPPGVGVWGDAPWVLLATLELQADDLNEGITNLLLGDSNPPDLTEGFAMEPPPVGIFANAIYMPGQVEVIPEPASLAILAIGALGLLRRRRIHR